MSDLTGFLRRRLDDDWAEAQKLAADGHLSSFQIARVGEDQRARRLLVDSIAPMRETATETELDNPDLARAMHGLVAGMEVALKFLALAYAAHRDWRPEWHPEAQS